MYKLAKRALGAMWLVLFAATLAIVVGFREPWVVVAENFFPLPNGAYLALGLCGAAALLWLGHRWGARAEAFFARYGRFLLGGSLALLLVWQLAACYGGYFRAGWDPRVIRNAVELELFPGTVSVIEDYFSWFPNNLLPVWVYKTVAQAARLCGIGNWEYAVVAFQCVLDVAAVGLVYAVAARASGSRRVGFLAYFTAYFLAGVSPWFMVPYSDALGFLFPVLLVWLDLRAEAAADLRRRALWYLLLGAVASAGYCIKPQSFIVCIAVMLVGFARWPGKGARKRFPAFAGLVVPVVAGVLLGTLCIQNLLLPTLSTESVPEKRIGWQHYLMMGLNRDTDGVYSPKDYAFTKSFPTNAERNAADLAEAVRRAKTMGAKNLLRHWCRKQLMTFGDGTFSWNVEGDWSDGSPAWAHNALSGFVRRFTEKGNHGEARPDLMAFNGSKQLLWMPVLFFQLFVFASPRREEEQGEHTVTVTALAVVGVALFEVLFEPRARYLFGYAPLFAVLFAWGMRNAYRLVRRCAQKEKR